MVLSPWAEPLPPDEQPAPLSVESGGAPRGANCLLLEAYEGTARCEADEAETAPMGESNTFRRAAASGVAVAMPPAARGPCLRLEASFQEGEEEPGAPFCVLRLPLSLAG